MACVTNLQYEQYCILKVAICTFIQIHQCGVVEFTAPMFWLETLLKHWLIYTGLHGIKAHLQSLVPALRTSDMLTRCYRSSQQVTTSASWETSCSSADQGCHLKPSS